MPVRVFVGNVAADATETELGEHFNKYNPSKIWYVVHLYMNTHVGHDVTAKSCQPSSNQQPRSQWSNGRVARKPPGFAFIDFPDERDADDAVRKIDG